MPCIAHILHFEARTEYIAHIVHIARTRRRVDVQPWRVRCSTHSTYSKDPGKSGCSAAWRVKIQHIEHIEGLGEEWMFSGLAQLQCRAGGAGEASMFAKTVGLDDSFVFFFLGRIPTC